MLKNIVKVIFAGLLVFACYWFAFHGEPSFPYNVEQALFEDLYANCSKTEMGLSENIQGWKFTEAIPTKKLPDWEKEPVFTRTVKLKGYYLPEGKSGLKNQERFKARLIVKVDRTDPQKPVIKVEDIRALR